MNDRTCPIMGHRLVSSGQIDYAFPRRDGLKRRHGAHRRCRPAEKARRARDVPIEPRGNPMENAAPDSMFVQWQRFMAGHAPGDPTPKISLPVESSRGGQLMIRLERVERIGEGKLFFRKVFPPQTPPLPFQRLLYLSKSLSAVFWAWTAVERAPLQS